MSVPYIIFEARDLSSYDNEVVIPLTLETISLIPDHDLKLPFEYEPLLKCFKGKKVTLHREEYESRVRQVCFRLDVLLRHVVIRDQVLIKLEDEIIDHAGASPIAAYYSILTHTNVFGIKLTVFQKYADNMFKKAIKTTRYILDLIVKQELLLYVNVVPWFLHFPFFIGETFPRVVTLLFACADEGWVGAFCGYLNIVKEDLSRHQTIQSIRNDPFLFTLLLHHLPVYKIIKWSLYKRFYNMLWSEKERKEGGEQSPCARCFSETQQSSCYLFFILLSKHCFHAIRYLKMRISVKRRKLITKCYDRSSFMPTHEEIDELYKICSLSEELSCSCSSLSVESSSSSSSEIEGVSFLSSISSWFRATTTLSNNSFVSSSPPDS